MKIVSGSPSESKHAKRYNNTVSFLANHPLQNKNILNLGPTNPLSDLLREKNYAITDTAINQDLDLDYDVVKSNAYDAVVAFEILEHMVSPFPLLQSISAKQLVITVPLSLWFAKAYWNEKDPYDRHYHEFEPKQIRMLLEKSGWKIIEEKMYTSPAKKIGFRPILRYFTPRHYFAYCER